MERTNLTLIETAIELRERGNKPLSRGVWLAVSKLSEDEARAALFRILGSAGGETIQYLANCMIKGVKDSIRDSEAFATRVLEEIKRDTE